MLEKRDINQRIDYSFGSSLQTEMSAMKKVIRNHENTLQKNKMQSGDSKKASPGNEFELRNEVIEFYQAKKE